MRIDGDATYIDKDGRRHTIDGDGLISDEIELQSLNVDGSVSFDKISCRKVKIDGECSGNSLISEKIVVDGDIDVDIIKSTKSIEIDGECSAESLSAEKIFIDGDVKVDNIKAVKSLEINGIPRINAIESDEVIVESSAGTIDEIQSNYLKIFTNNEFNGEISIGNIHIKSFSQRNSSQVRVEKIVSDKIDLENCKVMFIKCNNAVIRANCFIEKLIVSGKLELDKSSKIEEIIKE